MTLSMLRISALLSVLTLVAAAALGEPLTLGQGESLRSEILDEERSYNLALPSGYANSQARYPVVYLSGGLDAFHYTASLLKMLAAEDLVPPMITVGVPNTARTRDLSTPWASPNPPPEMKRFIARAGGADRFIEFLATELAPHIEKRYRTAPFRILIGRSLGGFFVLHTLFTAPEAFDGYIAISPSMHWDDGVILREADAYFDLPPDDSPKFLFLSLADEGGESRENYLRLVERLEYDAPANLDWVQRQFVEDDHGSSILPGIHRGMKTIFRGWRPPASQQEKGLEGYDQHFARLSKRYGFEIPVPESTINVLGLRTMMLGQPGEAVRILTRSVERYPDSAHARHCLGTALEENGQIELAIVQYERAVALATAIEASELTFYEERLEALHRALESSEVSPEPQSKERSRP